MKFHHLGLTSKKLKRVASKIIGYQLYAKKTIHNSMTILYVFEPVGEEENFLKFAKAVKAIIWRKGKSPPLCPGRSQQSLPLMGWY